MFSIKKTDLVNALTAVQRATQIKNSFMPVLSSVLFRKVSEFEIVGSDSASTVVKRLKYSGEPFDVIIPFRKLFDFTNSLPDSDINFELNGNNLLITCEKYKVKHTTMPVESFLVVPDFFEEEKSLSIKTRDLGSAIDDTLYAASSDESKPSLNSILFDFGNNKLNLVSTDSFRMAFALDIACDNTNIVREVIQKSGLGVLSSVLKFFGENIDVILLDGRVIFRNDDILCAISSMEDKFPEYTKFLQDFEDVAIFDKNQLVAMVRTISSFSDEQSNNVNLLLSNNKLTASAASETTSSESEITVEYSGAQKNISFRSALLLDALGNLSDKATMGFTSKFRGVYLKSKDNSVHIVMPVSS